MKDVEQKCISEYQTPLGFCGREIKDVKQKCIVGKETSSNDTILSVVSCMEGLRPKKHRLRQV